MGFEILCIVAAVVVFLLGRASVRQGVVLDWDDAEDLCGMARDRMYACQKEWQEAMKKEPDFQTAKVIEAKIARWRKVTEQLHDYYYEKQVRDRMGT